MRNRLTVQTHIGEGAIDSKKIVTTLLGGGDVLQTAGFRSERWFRISALTESHRSSAVYTPIRFKKIVTSAPRPAAALCCSGHMSLRALGGVRSCMQLNRFWFIPRNRVAPAPCQCCHCCGMNAAAAAWMRPTASRA